MKWPIGKMLRGVGSLLVPVIAQALLDALAKPRRVVEPPLDAQPELPLDAPVFKPSES